MAFDHLFTVEHRQLLRVALNTLEAVTSPELSQSLSPLLDLDFSRIPATPSERRTSYDSYTDGVNDSYSDESASTASSTAGEPAPRLFGGEGET